MHLDFPIHCWRKTVGRVRAAVVEEVEAPRPSGGGAGRVRERSARGGPAWRIVPDAKVAPGKSLPRKDRESKTSRLLCSDHVRIVS